MSSEDQQDLQAIESRAAEWRQVRPVWCPHQHCQFKVHSQDSVCVGMLPQPELHIDTLNTHRFCLHGAKDDGDWTFDLTLNSSDVYNITRILKQVVEDDYYENQQPR
jgi:hypothetical protein